MHLLIQYAFLLYTDGVSFLQIRHRLMFSPPVFNFYKWLQIAAVSAASALSHERKVRNCHERHHSYFSVLPKDIKIFVQQLEAQQSVL